MPKPDARLIVDADTSPAAREIKKLNKSLAAVKLDSLLNLANRAGDAGKAMIDTVSKVENLQMRLKVITGSSENAAIAFRNLTALSRQMPGGVAEATDAFVKLKALGLDPSKQALLAYANTAAGMGKSLDQLIEAVADASVGEFERLKEFGIKASKEGNKIKFTFQGVTTEVDNDSQKIQEYLQRIGNEKFGNAAKEQGDTLSESLNELQSSLDILVSNFGAATGITNAFKDAVKTLTGWVNELAEAFDGIGHPIEETEAALKRAQAEMEKYANNPAMADYYDEQKTKVANLTAELERLQAIAGKGNTLEQDQTTGELKVLPGQNRQQPVDAGLVSPETEEDVAARLAREEAARAAAYQRQIEAEETQKELLKQIKDEYNDWFGSDLFNEELTYEESLGRRLQMLEDHHNAQLITDKEYQQAKKNIEDQVVDNAIDGFKAMGDAFGSQSKEMFAVMKAFNIGQAIMNTFTAATEALKLPFPLNWIQMGAVVASGMAQVASIRSQQYQGRMYGGSVTGNTPYLVGERGPELMVPGRTGTVVPNNELGGGKNVNVSFTINAVDTAGFDQLLQERRPVIVNMIKQASFEEPGTLGAR